MWIHVFFVRILKRPFAADAYLKNILDEAVVLNDSVVQRIWNSPVLSLRLRRRIQESSEGSSVGSAANLKAAKHRFESFAAPLGRMLLHLEEFLDEVQETCDDRGASKEAEDCWRWLSTLDEEKLYQLGMLADCSDEILVATRQVDKEDVDTSMMHDAARALLERMDALFNKKQCLEIPGYTTHVLQILKKTNRTWPAGCNQINWWSWRRWKHSLGALLSTYGSLCSSSGRRGSNRISRL